MSRPCLSLAVALARILVPGVAAAQPAMPLPDTAIPRYALSVDSVRHEVVITLGPYHVPSESGMEDMMAAMPMGEVLSPGFDWPMRAAIRGYRVTVEDSAGHRLSRRLLHHYGVIEFDRRELAYAVLHHLLGGGAETDDVELPSTVGVPLSAGDRMAVYFMWHNSTGRDLDGVYLRLRVLWIAGNLMPRPTLALPFWLDVNYHVGGTDTFVVPPGGGIRTYVFTLPMSGHLLVVGGHLHEFGSSVRLEDAETGERIVRVVAHRDADGTVRSMSRKLFGLFGEGPHLLAGHRYLLVVTYDNPTADTLSGVMGLLAGLFVPDDMTGWPALDRSDPMYARDLAFWESTMPAGRIVLDRR
jgi:hypothetical protein